MTAPHPAVQAVLQDPKSAPFSDSDRNLFGLEHFTSLSLARSLAVGCLSRLDQNLRAVDIWDPAVGLGYAGSMLAEALDSTGVRVHYRGQDINRAAVSASKDRFADALDVEIAHGNTLEFDAFDGFAADLVIVDAPWGMSWKSSASAVETRRRKGGAFGFGLPQHSDSSWLFISLALEKLRSAADGGGRVAALVNPGALRAGGGSAEVRQRIVEAGLLESVTRLPDGLAPNTSIPLYLLTFTNRSGEVTKGKALIADLQTQFTTASGHRSMPISAFRELESGLRTRKPGPRNRSVDLRQFTRREARLSRVSNEGDWLSWRLTTYNDTTIDGHLLDSRYGAGAGVTVDEEPREVIDLDPSRIFGDDSRDLIKNVEAHGWPARRLSSLLAREPEPLKDSIGEGADGQLYVPTTWDGTVAVVGHDTGSAGRVLSVRLDGESLEPSFLAAWLNSEQGVSSRRRAIEASSSNFLKALRSSSSSLMRWADELIIPVPDRATQLELASADERLESFQAEVSTQRASIWSSPERVEEVVSRVASAFDDSLTAWLDQLPFPIASALWTAETATSPGEQQRAYIHAWEAIVTFHATVLLSASRSDPGSSSEVEAGIRKALQAQHLGIERSSFGTWVVIIERTSKDLRRALERGDADEVARIRHAFGGLDRPGIERLLSKDLVKKFNELNGKRNRWLGHTGYKSEDEWRAQVVSLIADLRELRQLLGNVWSQLFLVRAGSAKRGHDGFLQSAEIAMGTRSPFITRDFAVGEVMLAGELYLVRDGSQTPLRVGRFVQLRAAPRNAQYTSYFYNRTDGASVRMISYQFGPESEVEEDAERFRDEFGSLTQSA